MGDSGDEDQVRVLIVDDEPSYRDYLERYLKREGYGVRTASTGEEALAIGEVFSPHVILADWMLKDHVHGLQVAETLRDLKPDLKSCYVDQQLFLAQVLRSKQACPNLPVVRHLHSVPTRAANSIWIRRVGTTNGPATSLEPAPLCACNVSNAPPVAGPSVRRPSRPATG